MNEWGIPDWRDPAAYGGTEKWEWSRWRWEFYRRRDDLRQDFWDRAQSTYEFYHRYYFENPSLGVDPDTILKPTDAGFTARAYMVDPYNMIGIPNPAISEQPHWATSVIDRPNDIEVIYCATDMDCSPLEQEGLISKIDLDRPLSAQIETLQKQAKTYQRMRHGKLLQKRNHDTRWLTYLRAMDAREAKKLRQANAPSGWPEIAKILPLVNSVEGARKAYQAGLDLSFNF